MTVHMGKHRISAVTRLPDYTGACTGSGKQTVHLGTCRGIFLLAGEWSCQAAAAGNISPVDHTRHVGALLASHLQEWQPIRRSATATLLSQKGRHCQAITRSGTHSIGVSHYTIISFPHKIQAKGQGPFRYPSLNNAAEAGARLGSCGQRAARHAAAITQGDGVAGTLNAQEGVH